ncbi:MAG: hypothetical protein BWK76_17025 [Desulfobulbaceae bacterium A2]|nr:MAG: hypothetical protein BWK76_17025 [Desulfobulbaceae bacterium A2]
MNVLMISSQFRPLVGGYERSAERLSLALAARGNQVTVITERRDKSWARSEMLERVNVLRLWCCYRRHLHQLTSCISIARFLCTQGRQFQVWHIHQYGVHAALAIFLSKFYRCHTVLKLTSSGPGGIHITGKKGIILSFVKSQLLKVDAVVATSRETASEAMVFGISSPRVHVLGNGVDTACYRPHNEAACRNVRKKLGLNALGVVLAVGRLSSEKNPDGLIQAWKSARSDLPTGWKLVLVGDGPLLGTLRDTIQRESLGDTVLLVGQQENVAEWMAAADMFALPSHYEGLSNAMLEAMASGLPVIATRVSAVDELIVETKAGVGVDVGNMRQFASALVQLSLDSSLRQAMGRAGRQVIEKRYSIDEIARRHEQLYEKLLSA